MLISYVPTKCWFETFSELDGGHIIPINNKSCKVLGIGSIRLRMSNGIEKLLKDVRYIPELRKYLISLAVLDQAGYIFKFEYGTFKITEGSMTIMKWIIKNVLYTLVAKTTIGEASTVQSNIDCKIKI